MRKFRVAKRVLMLVLCGMLAVPAAGMLARPMVVEAAQDDSVPEAKKVARNKKASNLKSYYDKYANLMSSEDKTALDTSVNAVITQIQPSAARKFAPRRRGERAVGFVCKTFAV